VVRTVVPLSPRHAEQLESWRYDPPYDLYDGGDEPVVSPERFFAVLEDDELVGHYYLEEKGDAVEIGLGLRPDLTRRGLGLAFFREGVEFARAFERWGDVEFVEMEERA
jgi:[ribosomal protein S18]-alanine N-acetyltransferase